MYNKKTCQNKCPDFIVWKSYVLCFSSQRGRFPGTSRGAARSVHLNVHHLRRRRDGQRSTGDVRNTDVQRTTSSRTGKDKSHTPTKF